MSFRNVQGNDIPNNKTLKAPAQSPVWTRNPTWTAMPSTTSSNEQIDMLIAINPDSNFIAFTCNTSTGTYNVDWGDGTNNNYSSGTAAEHQYTYTDAALANTNGPVTFQDSGDTVTRTSHGYANGMSISFASITSTTGISVGQIYYVINATANTFQLASTIGGSALALTTDGSGTILPYKQALIKVICNTGGATFSTINLQVKNSTTGLQAYAQPILDLTISANVSTLTIGGTTVPLRLMERCTILRHNTTSMASKFDTCIALQSVPLFNTASVTTTGSMFNNCYNLKSVPLFNTASATSMNSMFSGCGNLLSVPLFNTVSATNMNSMFSGCGNLLSVPLFNTASVTTMSGMFNNCRSLTTVPLFNTASVTDMGSMFINCSALQTVPLFNTVSVTSMNNMFNSCVSLQSVPLFNTINVTDFSSMFLSCAQLTIVPLFNMTAATAINGMFNSCTALQSIPLYSPQGTALNVNAMFNACNSLKTIPLINTSTSTNMGNMFSNCLSLQTVPALNASLVTTMANFTTTPSLTSISMVGISKTFSVAGCKLSGTALNEIYTNLSACGTATVTFTDSTDLVGLTNHGYVEGQPIVFSTITTTTGISTSVTYYARNPTANTFQLSATKTGSIINLVNDGTGVISGTTQTITVSSNWGIATDTPSIATAKGWTVTGS